MGTGTLAEPHEEGQVGYLPPRLKCHVGLAFTSQDLLCMR